MICPPKSTNKTPTSAIVDSVNTRCCSHFLGGDWCRSSVNKSHSDVFFSLVLLVLLVSAVDLKQSVLGVAQLF